MVRMIFYNIEYFEGLRGRKLEYLKFWRRFIHPKGFEEKVAAALKEYSPDILSLVEIGGHSLLEDDYFHYIKKMLDMKYQVKRIKYQLGSMRLLKFLPFFHNQSNGILSKKRIFNSEVLYLKEGVKRAVIKVDFHIPQKISLLLAHLALGENARRRQIDELAEKVKKIQNPVILAGDFNTFRGEKEIHALTECMADEHGFKLHGGRVLTYPAYHPRKRFDYILTRGLNVKDYKVLKLDFSDHLPVMIDFEAKK
jgi:endonuclease/exonuclease/phosphatase family metal-dependent hydrolase